MKALEEKILAEGKVYPGNIIKVDSFLNHQLDVHFLGNMADEVVRLFNDVQIDKVLTIEASGIAFATLVAERLGTKCVFAKKTQSINLGKDTLSTPVKSYTHQRTYEVILAQHVIRPGEHVLLVDDLLANGCALRGLIDLVEQGAATVEGIAIAIEKGFQIGGKELREEGYNLQSLAIIDTLEPGNIRFRDQ